MEFDIFLKLWRNIVIKKTILRYVSLYNKNKIVNFDNLNSLLVYEEREFITTIKYIGDEMDREFKKGDIPDDCKELDLSECEIIIPIIAIPQNIEKITYNYFNDYSDIQLSELPLSLHTIENVSLKKPYSTNEIPLNIKSISFNGNIDHYELRDVKFNSSSLTKLCLLTLRSEWSYDLPLSLTELSICYFENFKSNFKIPSSVKKLTLNVVNGGNLEQNVIPYGVKDLLLYSSGKGINIKEGILPSSITKLSIFCGIGENAGVEPNSIPTSVSELFIKFPQYPISFNNIFPNNLVKLELFSSIRSRPPPTISDLPTSIKKLKIDDKEINI